MRRTFGERCSSHASATDIGVASSRAATAERASDCRGGESAEGEEQDVGDPRRREPVDERVVRPVRQVVHVLHRDDRGDRLRLGDLAGRGVADAEVPDHALPLQVDERLERLADALRDRSVGVAEPQVHEVEDVDAEGLQVVVDLRAELVGCARGRPASLPVSASAGLGGDQQVGGVGAERLPDHLVDDAGPVGLGRVDVRDPGGDGLAQDLEGGLAVRGRAEDPGSGELHGPVAEARHGAVAEGLGAAGQVGCGGAHGVCPPGLVGRGVVLHHGGSAIHPEAGT
jgi:hypothetical protein